ncbi:MAG: Periplasmic thiol:disulfide interchange protein DsbA [Candidatus Nomurabacteria bacterium GW2011_GWF2_35_66]|uniref:Periplasmic thiol:disulfide interchange protein DsbA n=1 Tax=Candidatus Nomurabacteria bacterium GW2011_GWE1_35_16 TaxID=1618761 RepID=A0A0G0BA79_9BACT|nr:MAG: Periplasmic thiol:disulfide interchange protein DsbA [Candidatus Nomurabacteria bacterium GW2011_GWF1_34_20]KKP63135.1 MAG: Periplasmic thiol:disulfide interchange protein DsbA [Candidatus Nomurabacteria bacterium GW2011_GWE2_34_25]KKP66338.1 MAG: Periplasmic thiol:disulfide interchange protein DsbA [Candidatus Nomurabacteria bacterium GW2011_GWE1_35_16]KKP83221.1 MAG: Periplasmic thiol:disulfide interchange protein DsbA [Candidatus Nomurabacteria bacterium GW2011_GWF2_35_66]HAE36328.1 
MENEKKQSINTPTAIIVAGVLIMIAILVTNSSGVGNKIEKEKTLSEQVGVKKEAMDSCMKDTNLEDLYSSTATSADIVMKDIPALQRGTPYIVLVGKDGTKMELLGNIPYDDYNIPDVTEKQKGVKTTIDNMLAGTAISNYKGEIPLPNEKDHIIGNLDALVTIIEYSDLECPYCKAFSVTAKKIVAESNGKVAWIYRHWPVHVNTSKGQYALQKAAASECVAKLKDNNAFWKYIDLVFGLMKTADDVEPTDNL